MTSSSKSGIYSSRIWLASRSVFIQGIGLAGFATFIEGIRQIYQPAAMIVGGGLVVFWTILKVRST